MSSSLGPIHYLMYEKIKFQDKITERLLSEDKLNELNKIMPPVPLDNLKDILDQDNIHGFLSAKIDVVESRLAYAINNGENIYEKAYEFGREIAPDKLESNEEIFDFVNKIILDGMPCDHALTAAVDANGDLNLILNVNTHKKYEDNPLEINPEDSLDNSCAGEHDHDDHESFHVQENVEINANNSDSKYLKLREELLKGFLENSNHDVKRHGSNFIIK
ncbi:hypothetical protein KQI68_09290 [Peptoniphilus sp. MSJ-1]|uniref:Uncharacterized protein n=1 Tax=Peptoniphilus ovalis TaxID=2841503 RepID=A0ABS6FIY0_9FIRM|nr:hypothetical protein [Peptoniphilus ovalis]MBU5670023.1 hypothetical protein [Peptoniphilus ovalis]